MASLQMGLYNRPKFFKEENIMKNTQYEVTIKRMTSEEFETKKNTMEFKDYETIRITEHCGCYNFYTVMYNPTEGNQSLRIDLDLHKACKECWNIIHQL